MIRCMLDSGEGGVRTGGTELLIEWQRHRQGKFWLDIQEEDVAGERKLLESMGLHALAVQDAQRDRHPPKLEEFDGFTFVLYRGIASFNEELEHQSQNIAFFVSDDFLVTRHPKPAVSIEKLFTDQGAALLKQGPGYLALRIMHTSAGLYLDALLKFEERLSDIEDSLMSNGNDDIMRELVTYRTRLVKLRRLFNYHRNITDELRSEEYIALNCKDDTMGHAITDLHDRFDRLYTLAEIFYSISGDLIDGYISIASHQLNRTMQVLTVITAIFVPLGFLAGLYGMNFEYIPELKIENGYFILLAAMGSIAVGLLALFRKIRWL
ncbi:MAG: metal transporter [Thalassolituus sp.]|nr:magnesium transporter CorA family protein [Pseudomonadota bacterium]MEC8102887.1 magnesium transporter CorA family protein [Pseudomonadota bacterium]MEC8523616.1 magnesium transporter CorA family protein [Pseudomonadota bacterium]MEE2749565.1 magnesium transporter CorA family protein [Pseudomonadota bacterium]TNC86740.1 MAG: metal transporter [Thalassolituus sp.]